VRLAVLALLLVPAAAATTLDAPTASWDGVLAVHVHADAAITGIALNPGPGTATIHGVDAWITTRLPDGPQDWALTVTTGNVTQLLAGHTYIHDLSAQLQALAATQVGLNATLQGTTQAAQGARDAAAGAQGVAVQARDAAQGIHIPTDYATRADAEKASAGAEGASRTAAAAVASTRGTVGFFAVLSAMLLAAIGFVEYRRWRDRAATPDQKILMLAAARMLGITRTSHAYIEAEYDLGYADRRHAANEGPVRLITEEEDHVHYG
jgi:hypothetical protein